MQETIDFLKSCQIFFVATVEDNLPKVRPFGALNEFKGRLYFITGKHKEIYKQLILNNHVEICASKSDSWLRLTGKAIFDETIEAKVSMLNNNPGLRMMYNEMDDKMALFYLEDAEATFYSFVTSPRTVTF